MTTIELEIVANAIINMVKPIRRPITDILVEDFGVYESSISDMTTTVSNKSTPIVTRSTHVGGSINMLIAMKRIKIHGQINKFT